MRFAVLFTPLDSFTKLVKDIFFFSIPFFLEELPFRFFSS